MISRRSVVRGTMAGGLAGAIFKTSPNAFGQAPSSKRLIVDSQVHLWKAESEDWKWVPGMKPQLPEPFTTEKLIALMDEAGVNRVVVVPPSWPGDRNDYALEAAQRHPTRFGIMGRIALKNPQAAVLLPKWKEQPGMLGVRLTFLGPAASWVTDGTADWFWPAAEAAGLPVMFLASEQGPAFARIAERHPRLTMIVDHMGVTSDVAQAGRTAGAIAQIAALSKYPNVSVKLSASPGNSNEAYPFRDMDDHIHRLFDAFGPQRSYWGTDMTNSFAKATYGQRITHFTRELPFLSESDKDWVMGRAILARLGWA